MRYVNRNYAHPTLTGFYRMAKVGLVTPLRDGMNLVAHEYIGSQNPADPGVLVLSRFAGAAEIFDAALLVNPFDTDETAEALRLALDMPLDERISRWQTLMAAARAHNIDDWSRSFLDRLAPASRNGSGTRDILYLASVA